jgi:hypothetical protein
MPSDTATPLSNGATTFSLGRAARAVDRAKSTISRDIKSGKLSATRNANGSVTIDAAELYRVYPPGVAATGAEHAESNERQPVAKPDATAAERREIELLRQWLSDKDSQIADLRRRLDQATALLTDQRPVERRPWWRRWAGG